MSDLRSRVLGTIFGTLSRGSFPKREPVAFLYNGVRLPVLAEWDTKVHPYGALFYSTVENYAMMMVCTNPFVYKGDSTSITPDGAFIVYRMELDTQEWYVFRSGQAGGRGMDSEPIWSNHDILRDTDGSVMLAGSEPIPVYE